jgi:hypothetical protein
MMQKVKSVLLTIAIICIGVSVMGWVTLNLLLKPSPTTESPELVAAKTQAQLAELARQQASNAWWGGFWQVVAILLLLTVLGGCGVVIAIKWKGFTHRIRVEEAQLRLNTMIIQPDQNGNFPLTRVNGEFVRYKPGNGPLALPSGPIGLLPEGKSRSNRQMDIAGQAYSVQGPIPSRASQRTTPRNNSSSAQPAQVRETEMRMIESLRSAKEGKRGKVKSIQKVCNILPGDTDEYEKWSLIWDNLD